MFVAHHWRQRRGAHGAEANLQEGSRAAHDFRRLPPTLFAEELRHTPAEPQPGYTHWENQGAEQVANHLRLTCAQKVGMLGLSQTYTETETS